MEKYTVFKKPGIRSQNTINISKNNIKTSFFMNKTASNHNKRLTQTQNDLIDENFNKISDFYKDKNLQTRTTWGIGEKISNETTAVQTAKDGFNIKSKAKKIGSLPMIPKISHEHKTSFGLLGISELNHISHIGVTNHKTDHLGFNLPDKPHINTNMTIPSQQSINNDKKKNIFGGKKNLNKKMLNLFNPVLGNILKGMEDHIGNIINDIKKIRNLMKDEYKRISSRGASKYIEQIKKKWLEITNLLIQLDVRTALYALKLLGDIYIEFDDYVRAKGVYSFYKHLALGLELLEELMIAYECLGMVNKFLYKHEKSIIYYKKQIEVAWILGDKNSELRAYDNIGIQYFYLGNKTRAKFYHLRFICGRYEKDTSDIKKKSKKDFYDKNFNFFNVETRDEKEYFVYKNKNVDDVVLRVKLEELIMNFENYKSYESLDNISLGSYIPESLNNSNVSKCNITFNIISSFFILVREHNENSDDDDENDKQQQETKKKEKIDKNYKKNKKNSVIKTDNKLTNTNIEENTIILSHLSLKRKEYFIERFEYIFKEFDNRIKDLDAIYNREKQEN